MNKASDSIQKLLIIAYRFPPIKSMSSYRNYCIAKHSKDYFEKIEVISTTNSWVLPKENLDLENIAIFRSPTLDYRTIFHSKKSSGVVDNGGKMKAFFRNLKNSFPFNLIFGLGGIFYIFFGILLGIYRMRKNKFTHIFSSFRPYADHIIAYCIKLIYPSTFWIADFNNLHVEPDTKRVVFSNFQKKINKFLLSKADIISTVSQGLVSHLEPFNKNVIVLENAIDSEEPKLKKRKEDKFIISYTGSLYPEQEISSLLNVIKNLIEREHVNKDRICLQYAGSSSELWNKQILKYGLELINKNYGVLSFEDALNIQYNSNINLLLSWTTPNLKMIIPGKFYDYLYVGKPILLLINGEKDLLWEERFKKLNNSFISYNKACNENDLGAFIQKLYQEWLTKKHEFLIEEEIKFEHTWNCRIAAFFNQIEA